MADYREISQQYAQGGMKAGVLLNGGAAIALLSQVADLYAAKLIGGVRPALICSALGTFCAAAAWMFAFLSTRYVDKSEREPDLEVQHLHRSNKWMYAGLAAIALSLLLFVGGALILACKFGN
ncbi:Uncharacterised protein [Starkeya nomas]|uniref:DUF202 domain-containing protein n=1 Tax=Starkeya nomas TaxID=2666134 RepID=A0A5S9NZR4_9HYPH|nr:hypothetical protein [Starkeya nomas]CAA0096363.1 Uncharacterised protein [Starkeya nomas]